MFPKYCFSQTDTFFLLVRPLYFSLSDYYFRTKLILNQPAKTMLSEECKDLNVKKSCSSAFLRNYLQISFLSHDLTSFLSEIIRKACFLMNSGE